MSAPLSGLWAPAPSHGEPYESEETLIPHDRRVLERDARAKDEFLAMLGHELRNPLDAIAAAVRVLDSGGAGDRSIALDVLQRQVGTATRVLDDLLDVARIARGHIELRPARVDLAEVARRAVEVVRPLPEARRHASLSREGARPWRGWPTPARGLRRMYCPASSTPSCSPSARSTGPAGAWASG